MKTIVNLMFLSLWRPSYTHLLKNSPIEHCEPYLLHQGCVGRAPPEEVTNFCMHITFICLACIGKLVSISEIFWVYLMVDICAIEGTRKYLDPSSDNSSHLPKSFHFQRGSDGLMILFYIRVWNGPGKCKQMYYICFLCSEVNRCIALASPSLNGKCPIFADLTYLSTWPPWNAFSKLRELFFFPCSDGCIALLNGRNAFQLTVLCLTHLLWPSSGQVDLST